MAGRTPTLGYASRTDAVNALRRIGLSTKQIADRIGIEPKAVHALECSSLKSKRRVERRGISANELLRQIAETVLDEGLVDSVLDDAEEQTA